MIESKRKFKHEFKCAAVGCPFKKVCLHAKRDKDEVREVIKAPYKKVNGKFAGCDFQLW